MNRWAKLHVSADFQNIPCVQVRPSHGFYGSFYIFITVKVGISCSVHTSRQVLANDVWQRYADITIFNMAFRHLKFSKFAVLLVILLCYFVVMPPISHYCGASGRTAAAKNCCCLQARPSGISVLNLQYIPRQQ